MSVEVVGIALKMIAGDTFFSHDLAEPALVFNAKHHLAVYFLDDNHLQRIYVNSLLIFFDKVRSNRVFLTEHSHFDKLLTTVIYKFNKFIDRFNSFGKSEIVVVKLKYFHFYTSLKK